MTTAVIGATGRVGSEISHARRDVPRRVRRGPARVVSPLGVCTIDPPCPR